MLKLACILLGLGLGSWGSQEADLVDHFPGITFTPNFRHFSGYINVSSTDRLHYWLFESETGNADKDPLLLWLPGGPACSVADVVLRQTGPFRLHPHDPTKIVENVYAWNKVANVLYLDAPAGVGFSYSSQPEEAVDDDTMTQVSMNALMDFLELYPEYKGRDLYLAGESYASVHVASLGDLLRKNAHVFPGFKGILIGNGLLDKKLNFNSMLEFAYSKGLLDPDDYDRVVDVCCFGACASECDYFHEIVIMENKRCRSNVLSVLTGLYTMGLDPYDLYESCYANDKASLQYLSMLLKPAGVTVDSRDLSLYREANTTCDITEATTAYLNRDDVRQALHLTDFPTPSFHMCNKNLSWESTWHSGQLSNYIDDLLLSERLRILLYQGDGDILCNPLGAERFVHSLLMADKINAKHPLRYQDEIVGFWTQYKQMDLLTIREAGHFVPTSQPALALHVFASFLNGQAYELPTHIPVDPQPCSDDYCRRNIDNSTTMALETTAEAATTQPKVVTSLPPASPSEATDTTPERPSAGSSLPTRGSSRQTISGGSEPGLSSATPHPQLSTTTQAAPGLRAVISLLLPVAAICLLALF